MIIQVINVTCRKQHHHQVPGIKNVKMNQIARIVAITKLGRAAVIIKGSKVFHFYENIKN